MPHDEDEGARRHEPRLPRQRTGVEPHLSRRSKTVATAVTLLMSLGAFAGLAGCASQPRPHPIFVMFAPPPDPVELEGSAPSPVYVWARGHYNWNGYEYVWTPGHWSQRPNARAIWSAGHWQRTRIGYTWVEGHWS